MIKATLCEFTLGLKSWVNRSPKQRLPVAPQNGFKIHGQCQLKSKTEGTSGPHKIAFEQSQPKAKRESISGSANCWLLTTFFKIPTSCATDVSQKSGFLRGVCQSCIPLLPVGFGIWSIQWCEALMWVYLDVLASLCTVNSLPLRSYSNSCFIQGKGKLSPGINVTQVRTKSSTPFLKEHFTFLAEKLCMAATKSIM